MPELPEVETVAAGLRQILKGREIVRVECGTKQLRYEVDFASLRKIGRRARVSTIARRGKYLAWELTSGHAIIVHLGMSGRFCHVADERPPGKHDHLTFHLDDQSHLRYRDPRRFGAIIPIVGGDWSSHPLIASLGPDPVYNIDAERLCTLARRRTVPIKQFLLDQTVLAGIGNIYASEILFRAAIHPLTVVNDLPQSAWTAIADAITETLQYAIAVGGTTLRDGGFSDVSGNYGEFQIVLKVYGHAGDPCHACRTPIASTRLGNRSTFFCPKCQAVFFLRPKVRKPSSKL